MFPVALTASMLIFFTCAVPIAVTLGMVSAMAMYGSGIPLQAMIQRMFAALDSFPLTAIPFFILAGALMEVSGISTRLVNFAQSLVGRATGGLGLVAVLSAMFFAAISGSSAATTAAIGGILIPAMAARGYSRPFATSVQASSGELGVIIPPSIPMIIYAIAAQVSVTKLFLAGIVPGIIIALCLAVYVMVKAHVQMIPLGEPARWANIWSTFKEAVWALMAPVVILGGIYGGIFTPTEAAGIACIYAVVISVFVYKELDWAGVWKILLESTVLIAQIMIIVSAAAAYAWLITTSGIAQALVAYIQSIGMQTWLLLMTINILLLFVGSMLEPPAAILLLTPLLTPVVAAAGIDPIHFGLVVTVNLAVGLFLPPFGLNLFASHALFGTPLPELYRGVLPFLGIYIAVLILLTYVPAITLLPLKLFE